MSLYTTGEIANLANVSVRTIQYYDKKGILKPVKLSEGGRRLYDEESLKDLNLICLLKSIGLSLTQIKEIIEKKKLSQAELAKMSGVSRATIIRLESEADVETTIGTLQSLAAALEVSVEALFLP